MKSAHLQTCWRMVGQRLALLAVLCAPSLLMLARLPPLWKDVDAYIQVTEPPGVATILHYLPLASFLPRVPLYLGFVFDCLRDGTALPSLGFFAHPILSDSGVSLLLVFQHAALWATAFFLICSCARIFLARLVLAALWTLNPLPYAFAHCVGSETLSLLLLFCAAATGLKIVRAGGPISRRGWLLFAMLLMAGMLTRHINAVLAALLPLAFGLAALLRCGTALRQKAGRLRRFLFFRARKDFRRCAAAVALGIICFGLSQLTLRVLSGAAGIPFYSRIGFTFMWRVKSLADLSAPEREQVIAKALTNTKSPEVHTLLDFLRSEPSQANKTDVLTLMDKGRALLPPQIAASDDEYGRLLNKTVRAFLLPPSVPFLGLVWRDFARSQESTIPGVVRHLFRSTAFFFAHRDLMPGCAELVTFRESSRAEILQQIKKHSYLRIGKHLTYRQLFFVCLAGLVVAAFSSSRKSAALPAYASALILTALSFMLANCAFTEFTPRYTMPMWVLTIAATTLLLGSVIQKGLRFLALSISRKRNIRRAAAPAR